MYICTEPTHHVVGDSHQHNSAASPHRLRLNAQAKRGWLQTPKTEGQLRIPQKFGFMPQLELGSRKPYGGGASCDVSSSLSLSLFHIEFVLLRRNQAKISRGIEISSFRLGGRACGPGEAKLTSEHIVEGEPNRLKKSRDMSYSVYRTCMCVEEQKVLKCDRVNQRGSHNKIHHTEEDIGKLVVNLNSYKLNLVVKSVDALLFLFSGSEEGYTESQRKRRS
ncbi:hypothetical protein YC2023_023050 [Brassica napus]